MLSIDKVQAKKLRAKLLQLTAIERPDGRFDINLMHENGTIYALRMIDNPRPVVVSQLSTAKNFAQYLGFNRWSVRMLENEETA